MVFVLNPIHDGGFQGCVRMGGEAGAKRHPLLKSGTHIRQ